MIIELVITDSRGGSVRIVEQKEHGGVLVHDLVGWNTGSSLASCFEDEPTNLSSSKILTRYLNFDGSLVDTDSNARDFASQLEPVIDQCMNISGVQVAIPLGYSQNQETGACLEITADEIAGCDAVVISEVLPNPSGSDTGKEFIELHNTSAEEVSLEGCSLKTSANSKEYKLTNEVLKADEYKAYYDGETDLTLPNSSGGRVWLLSTTNEIDVVDYPVDMKDDVSYARFQDGWHQTFSNTPNEANNLLPEPPCPSGQQRDKESGRCRSVVSVVSIADCGPGRYRHPETNRCRNISAATSSLVPCAANQYRSPETNRCRNLAASSSTLQPCASDQFRNPETNRCKKIESSSILTPCKEGQERNPETNRCRKIPEALTPVTSPGQIPAAESKPLGFDYRVWTMLGVATLGYGVYEYRSELRRWTGDLRSKKQKMKPPG